MHECRRTLQRGRGIEGAVNPPAYFAVTCGLVLHFHSANCLFIESPRRRHELPARYGLTLASLSFSRVFSFPLTRLERGLNHTTRGDATLTVGHRRKLEAPLEPEWRSTYVRMSKGVLFTPWKKGFGVEREMCILRRRLARSPSVRVNFYNSNEKAPPPRL